MNRLYLAASTDNANSSCKMLFFIVLVWIVVQTVSFALSEAKPHDVSGIHPVLFFVFFAASEKSVCSSFTSKLMMMSE